jgi:tetratricopeptide (TPR) repeat protein
MSDNITPTELLIQYMDGELQGDLLTSVEDSIRLNPAVKTELENLRAAREAVISFGVKNQVGTLHREMMNELKNETLPRIIPARSFLRRSLSLAATVLLAVGLYTAYQYLATSPEKLFRESYQPFVLHETRGSAPSTLEDIYKKKDMEGTIRQFESLPSPAIQDYFMAGNAYLQTGRYPKAIASFTAVDQSNSTHQTHYFEEDAEYYLGLSYLGNNEPGRAIPIFEKIAADPSHPYHKKLSSWFMARLHRLDNKQ